MDCSSANDGLQMNECGLEKPHFSFERLFVVRHGETDWNAANRLQGRTDIALNETGRYQAKQNGQRMADYLSHLNEDLGNWHFVASPLKRTRETMEILREALGLERDGYDVSEQLIELCYGAWEGRSWQDLREEVPELIKDRFAHPWDMVAPGGGESHDEMRARVVSWMQGLPQKTIAVTHTGPLRIVRGAIDTSMSDDEIAVQVCPQDQFLDMRPDRFGWV